MTEPEPTEPERTQTAESEPTEPERTQTAESEPPETAALEQAESDAAAEAAAVAAPEPDALDGIDRTDGDDPLTSNDYTVAFSPRQVAVGLAIVAGLVAVVAARRHRRTSRESR